MNIISSTYAPVNSQPRFNNEAGSNAATSGERTKSVREVFAELIDDNNLSVPVSAVLEPAESEPQYQAQQRFSPERVDLSRYSGSESLPLSNQQALASYQFVANNTLAADIGIAPLDIFV